MATNTRRQKIETALQNPYVRAVLDMLAATELGKDGANGAGYDVVFGGGDQRITDFSAHPGTKGYYKDTTGKLRSSTAAGRYQFLQSTVKDLQKRYGFSDFTPQTQDAMAVALMMDVDALDDVMRGDINAALPKLGKRWASLHTSTHDRTLHGTRSSDFVYKAYNDALARYNPNATGVSAPVQQTSATQPAVSPTSFDFSGDFSEWRNRPILGGSVRDALNDRYARRRILATNAGRLNSETLASLSEALFNPNTKAVRHLPVPPHDTTGTSLTVPNPVGREGIPVQYVAPVATVTPGLFPPELAPAELRSTPTPQGPLSPVEPMNVTGYQLATPPNYDAAMAMLMAQTQAATPAEPPITPESNLLSQLSARENRTNVDPLSVNAYTASPYAEQLLKWIDATQVDLG